MLEITLALYLHKLIEQRVYMLYNDDNVWSDSLEIAGVRENKGMQFLPIFQ